MSDGMTEAYGRPKHMWGKPTYDDLERQVADLTQAVEVKEIAYQNTKASVAELTAKVQQLELGEILSANRVREAEAKVADLTAKLQTVRCDAVRDFVNGKDKLCLVCGAKEPCELKDDPSSPCTFDPTPMEFYKRCQELTAKLEAQNAEIRDMRKSIDTAAKGIVRLTTERDDLTAKLAAGRQWTNEQPRTPGWYWFIWKWRPDVCPDVHYVSEQDIAEGNPPGLWCGPLEAPR